MRNSDDSADRSSEGEFHDALDAGLRAAFGAPTQHSALGRGDPRFSILETLGVESRILLHDESDDSPVLAPADARKESAQPDVGRYQIHGEIARGGVGRVLKGRDVDLGRDVAMKVLLAEHKTRPIMIRRFMQEAQITGQLQHPGILPVYELGLRDDQRPFFTMKLVKGRTLSDLLADRAAPLDDLSRFLSIFEHVCQTMAYAHARGVVHRDLKPTNIMVGAFGEVQVLDWGLAKVLRSRTASATASEDNTTLNRDQNEQVEIRTRRGAGAHSVVGSVMGTPAYMPPEQASGDVDQIDERCDVFSLGAILCEILTGTPPFTGSKSEVLQDSAAGRLEPAINRLDASRANAELISIAKRCLSPARQDRPRSAADVAKSIGDYIAGIAAKARALELESAAAKVRREEEVRARRLRTGLVSTFLFALLIAAGAWYWNDHQRRARATNSARSLDASLGVAQQRLGEARASQIGRRSEWQAAIVAAGQLRTVADGPDMPDEAIARATAFLDEFDRDNADRRMVERIEDVVIVGATHQDADSWIWMDDQLLSAFRDYGIDLVTMPREEIASRIRDSRIAVKLCSGVELWIGTGADLLGRFGVSRYTEAQLRERVGILELADPDPYRNTLRRMMFMFEPPDVSKLKALAESRPFAEVAPVTLSWLAMTVGMAGDAEAMNDYYQQALLIYPSDFMLNFDYGYALTFSKDWSRAILYFMRCVAIRPEVAGVWRSLGIVQRENGDLKGSIDSLSESVRLQPDHAATYVDLGISLTRAHRIEDAIVALRRAVQLNGKLAAAHGYLGVILCQKGDSADAMVEFEQCKSLAGRDTTWPLPVDEWINDCNSSKNSSLP